MAGIWDNRSFKRSSQKDSRLTELNLMKSFTQRQLLKRYKLSFKTWWLCSILISCNRRKKTNEPWIQVCFRESCRNKFSMLVLKLGDSTRKWMQAPSRYQALKIKHQWHRLQYWIKPKVSRRKTIPSIVNLNSAIKWSLTIMLSNKPLKNHSLPWTTWFQFEAQFLMVHH